MRALEYHMPRHLRTLAGYLPRVIVAFIIILGAGVPGAWAGQVHVAVAANFLEPARAIGAAFSAASGHQVSFSAGPSGQLYAQIVNGAPYDVFLSADRERVQDAIDAGLAERGTRYTYAIGRLVLYSADATRMLGQDTLRAGRFEHLAIANPITAPYGAAALQVLQHLGLETLLAAKLVRGAGIAQAYQFVASGNAELGLVAQSQVIVHQDGARWLVPEQLHEPIAQEAVMLKRARDRAAAGAFMNFLGGAEADAIRQRYGYATAAPR